MSKVSVEIKGGKSDGLEFESFIVIGFEKVYKDGKVIRNISLIANTVLVNDIKAARDALDDSLHEHEKDCDCPECCLRKQLREVRKIRMKIEEAML